ncbi:sugar phosphate isomerase/epimerase [Pseudarthrobacter sp. SSS035]|uniref:sugar phosphate isomerase/epimerase family protein n=1 Tax=Pseudarthrobacter sp. SSS035 TaxID=2931399 RepID=UPI00200EBB46|nr:TIM barrel protein [Pseudarthrobacter sp. SSS035]
MNVLTPGICSVTLRNSSIEDVVDVVSTARLAGIEWSSQAHVFDAAAALRAKQATAAAGLKVLSLGSYYRVGSRGDFGAVTALASALGAPRIRVWAGESASLDASSQVWDAVVEDAQRISGLAAGYGLEIAFEYHGGTLTDSAETTLELLARVGRPNVGTYWQPAVGLTDEQAVESLRQVLDHVLGIHCFSWWPGRERLPLTDRKQLWHSVAEILRDRGASTDLMLEFVEADLPENVIRDSEFLTRITLGAEQATALKGGPE